MKVLKFYAEWCAPCKMLTKVITDAKDKISIPIEEVDIDQNIMMAQMFNVRSVPTMVIVDNEEKEIKRQLGYVNEEALLEFLKG
jgi:thioredoxin 1